jgi:hypothetical protein
MWRAYIGYYLLGKLKADMTTHCWGRWLRVGVWIGLWKWCKVFRHLYAFSPFRIRDCLAVKAFFFALPD